MTAETLQKLKNFCRREYGAAAYEWHLKDDNDRALTIAVFGLVIAAGTALDFALHGGPDAADIQAPSAAYAPAILPP